MRVSTSARGEWALRECHMDSRDRLNPRALEWTAAGHLEQPGDLHAYGNTVGDQRYPDTSHGNLVISRFFLLN